MNNVKVYAYPKCDTCRKALKWLDEHGIETEAIHIVERPPSEEELRQLIEASGLDIKKFFNTSGVVYKEMSLKEKLGAMSEQEQIKLLSSNGKLIKRPIVTDGRKATVGFNAAEFEKNWL
jgi:arsenate reductase